MKTIYYHILIDASKSMSRYWEELVRLLNSHLKTTQKIKSHYPIKLKTSLGAFNFQHIYLDVLGQSPVLLKKIKPEGLTALYDAIITSIKFVENDLIKLEKASESSIVFVILTDGHENASRLFNAEKVREDIVKLQKQGNWEFIFFGADLDVNEINKILKIPQFNYHNFEKSELKLAFEELNNIIYQTIKKSTKA